MRRILTILFTLIGAVNIEATERQKLNVFDKPDEQSDARFDSAMARKGRAKLNFNDGWRLQVGDFPEAMKPEFDDSQWQPVTLPYAFNGDEAFRKDIVDLTDTVCWYRKTFQAPLLSPEGEEAGLFPCTTSVISVLNVSHISLKTEMYVSRICGRKLNAEGDISPS